VFVVVVRESGDAEQIEASGEFVSTNVAPRVRQTPGFVSAMWLSDGSGGTLNVLTFETEHAARAVLELAKSSPRPSFMKVDSVELLRVLATA
jgi:hypothetical protein